MLVRGALEIEPGDDPATQTFTGHATEFFAPLRKPGADVLTSARQASAIYTWLQELMAAARRAGASEGLDDDGNPLRNDLIGNLDSAEGGEGEGPQGEEGDGDGEPDQNVRMEVSGKQAKGRGGRPLSPEEIRKLLEQGAEIKPRGRARRRRGRGHVPDPAHGQAAQELEEMREQLGEIGPASESWPAGADARARPGLVLLIRRMGLRAERLPAQWCRLREIPLTGDEDDFFANTLARYAEMLPQVRRNFQRIRPASYRMVRGLEDGEELDLDRTIEARVARLMGETPDPSRLQVLARKKRATSPRCSCSTCRPRPTSRSIARRASTPTMTTPTTG